VPAVEAARKVSVVSFGLFGDQGVFRREAGSGPINVQYNSKKGGRATIEALAMSLQAAAVALTAMPRVKIGPAIKDQKILDRRRRASARWRTVFRRRPPAGLPRHLLFRVLAYRLQADHFGDLDGESQRILDRAGSPEDSEQRALNLRRRTVNLGPGTVLGREWNGQMQHVAVLLGEECLDQSHEVGFIKFDLVASLELQHRLLQRKRQIGDG
jgi:Protein of unknown function (DUF2924)